DDAGDAVPDGAAGRLRVAAGGEIGAPALARLGRDDEDEADRLADAEGRRRFGDGARPQRLARGGREVGEGAVGDGEAAAAGDEGAEAWRDVGGDDLWARRGRLDLLEEPGGGGDELGVGGRAAVAGEGDAATPELDAVAAEPGGEPAGERARRPRRGQRGDAGRRGARPGGTLHRDDDRGRDDGGDERRDTARVGGGDEAERDDEPAGGERGEAAADERGELERREEREPGGDGGD